MCSTILISRSLLPTPYEESMMICAILEESVREILKSIPYTETTMHVWKLSRLRGRGALRDCCNSTRHYSSVLKFFCSNRTIARNFCSISSQFRSRGSNFLYPTPLSVIYAPCFRPLNFPPARAAPRYYSAFDLAIELP